MSPNPIPPLPTDAYNGAMVLAVIVAAIVVVIGVSLIVGGSYDRKASKNRGNHRLNLPDYKYRHP